MTRVTLNPRVTLNSNQRLNKEPFMISTNQDSQEAFDLYNILVANRDSMEKAQKQWVHFTTANFHHYSVVMQMKLKKWIENNNFQPWNIGGFDCGTLKMLINDFQCHFDQYIAQWREVHLLDHHYVTRLSKYFDVEGAIQNLFSAVKKGFKLDLIIKSVEIQESILQNQLLL